MKNKPTIPSVGNGTVTIKQAGTSKGTFTMNQSGNTTIELTDNNTWRGIQNNLTSDSTTDSLSANQGKVLKGLIDEKTNKEVTVAGNSGISILVATQPSDGTVGTGLRPDLYTYTILPVYGTKKETICQGNDPRLSNTSEAIVNFTSGDSSTGDSTAPAVITSGETHKSLFNKISTAVKNVRWLLSKMGTTDISTLGDGTVTGALSTLNSNITKIYHYYGELVNGQNTNIKAYGHADIIIYNNNLVQINFSYKFTSEDKDATATWKFGINSNLFVNLVGCSIIPITGGTVLYYKADGSLALNALEYCGIMMDNDNYWNPARLYTTDGAVGGWSSTYYDIGDYAIGTCYGLIPSLG